MRFFAYVWGVLSGSRWRKVDQVRKKNVADLYKTSQRIKASNQNTHAALDDLGRGINRNDVERN